MQRESSPASRPAAEAPGYLADEGKTQGGREKAQLTHREGLLALKIRQETRRRSGP